MGQFTQHGYGPADREEAFWNKPLYGTVSRGKAFNAVVWFLTGASVVSLAVAVWYRG